MVTAFSSFFPESSRFHHIHVTWAPPSPPRLFWFSVSMFAVAPIAYPGDPPVLSLLQCNHVDMLSRRYIIVGHPCHKGSSSRKNPGSLPPDTSDILEFLLLISFLASSPDTETRPRAWLSTHERSWSDDDNVVGSSLLPPPMSVLGHPSPAPWEMLFWLSISIMCVHSDREPYEKVRWVVLPGMGSPTSLEVSAPDRHTDKCPKAPIGSHPTIEKYQKHWGFLRWSYSARTHTHLVPALSSPLSSQFSYCHHTHVFRSRP